MNRIRACALTGHRELPAYFDFNLLRDALEQLLREGCDTFFCGMAPGFDLAALDGLMSLRGRYRFYVEACVPYEGFGRKLAQPARAEFFRLLDGCDRTTVLFPRYTAGCFLARNRYMVDCADVLLAFCRKESGGTAYTVKYAESKGIPVRFL